MSACHCHTNGITAKQQSSNVSLPPLEPQVFDGKPLSYREWRAEFRVIIEANVQDNMLRLFYLKKYTTGIARETISGFLQLSEPSSYDQAQELLKQRFGTPKVLEHEYRLKLELWESLRENCTKAKLQKFADFLNLCRSLKDNGYLDDRVQVWDWHQLIEFLLNKLPESVSSSCRSKLYPDGKVGNAFSILADCVSHAAENEFKEFFIYPCSYIYQSIKAMSKEKCQYCKSASHKSKECEDLQQLSKRDQRAFIQKAGLCYRCLKEGHKATACPTLDR